MFVKNEYPIYKSGSHAYLASINSISPTEEQSIIIIRIPAYPIGIINQDFYLLNFNTGFNYYNNLYLLISWHLAPIRHITCAYSVRQLWQQFVFGLTIHCQIWSFSSISTAIN